jgi:hypothetical protein
MIRIPKECSQATGQQSISPQQTNAYQECASEGTAAISIATINNANRISENLQFRFR